MTSPTRRRLERMGSWWRSKPSSSNASDPMNALPISVATSAGSNGPSPPNDSAASVATSVSTSYQPNSTLRAASASAGVDQPAAIISCSTRTYPDSRSSSRKSQACS